MGLSITVNNFGNIPICPLNWSITIDGPFVLAGRSISGSISELLPDQSMTLKSFMILGFGPITITVQIEESSFSANGFLIGPFVIL